MPATTSGTKTVAKHAGPHLTASALTTLLAIPVELLTVAQFDQIKDAVKRSPGGDEPSKTIGDLLS